MYIVLWYLHMPSFQNYYGRFVARREGVDAVIYRPCNDMFKIVTYLPPGVLFGAYMLLSIKVACWTLLKE